MTNHLKKNRKQVEVAQITRKALSQELEKQNNLLLETGAISNNLSKKKQEHQESYTSFVNQYEKFKITIEQKERVCDDILRNSEKIQLDIQHTKELRSVTESKLKHAHQIVLSIIVFIFCRIFCRFVKKQKN
jgi:hypothetical protein